MQVQSIGCIRGPVIQRVSAGGTAPKVTRRQESTDAGRDGEWGAQGGERGLI